MATPIRHIVLLSDGTGNSRGKHFTTNVWRVYEALDLADPANPTHPRQFAFYDDGVGSSSFTPLALLGGALGIGLLRNVRDLYAFLCRNWRPGDRVYAFGFSRGAFTIRLLIGLVAHQGVVPYDGNEAELDRLTSAALRAYRRERFRLRFRALDYVQALRVVRDTLLDGWARLRRKPTYRAVPKIGRQGSPDALEFAFVGLWDTVEAYGLPVDELTRAIDAVIWPGSMPSPDLHPCVQRAVHALALDDERNTFHPKLWRETAEPPPPPRADGRLQPPRIRQVWFAGMHSDVGGGYADQGLSHVSLGWVTGAATECDLRFTQDVRRQQQALSDENGPMNDSRHGLAGYYRYNPRRLEPMFARLQGIGRPTVHESVMRRIREGLDAYAPIVLPKDFDVLLFEGGIRPSADYLGLDAAGVAAYDRAREAVFNLVWRKRVVYFATLAATLVLLLLPLLAERPGLACESRWCALSPLIRALDVVLPGFLSGWTAWYAVNPGWFTALAVLVAAGLRAGSSLQLDIGDAMRAVWHGIDGARPASLACPGKKPAGIVDRAIEWLRTQPRYEAAFRQLTHRWLPAGFLAGLIYAGMVMVSVVSFALQASHGAICVGSAAALPLAEPWEGGFDSNQVCAPTGVSLQAGGSYVLTLSLPAGADGRAIGLMDDDVKADLRGIQPADLKLVHRIGAALKREPSQPWFLPIARIGTSGADLYPLRPDPSLAFDQPLTELRTRIVARSSGELFFYVNDAVGPPGWPGLYYHENNHGRVMVRIEPLRPGGDAGHAAPLPADAAASAPERRAGLGDRDGPR